MNHVKSNYVNLASSDSELHRQRLRPLTDSLTNLTDAGKRGLDGKDGAGAPAGIILPTVANMKQNVSEKVAQVSFLCVWMLSISLFPTISAVGKTRQSTPLSGIS